VAVVRSIFIIRHGEKPPDGQSGLDVFGNGNRHSLIPRGWHRAAALETLFAPSRGPLPSGLVIPTQLIAPDYDAPMPNIDETSQASQRSGSNIEPEAKPPGSNIEHRTSQTILPLARLTGLSILTHIKDAKGRPVHCKEGNEPAIDAAVAAETTSATLICWEHTAIYDIASNIKPVSNGDKIPKVWDKTRFDVIYSFTRSSASGPYSFSQILQRLFPDDPNTPMKDAAAATDLSGNAAATSLPQL